MSARVRLVLLCQLKFLLLDEEAKHNGVWIEAFDFDERHAEATLKARIDGY